MWLKGGNRSFTEGGKCVGRVDSLSCYVYKYTGGGEGVYIISCYVYN